MSDTAGDDVPRDPWGNPLPPEDQAPAHPTPDDYPPAFPVEPPTGASGTSSAPSPWPPALPEQPVPPAPSTAPQPSETAAPTNPAWPGPTATPPPAANPAWPGAQPPPAAPGTSSPPPAPAYGSPPPPGYPPPGWGQATQWAPPKNDGMAIGALVCGILSITCAGFLGIILGPVGIVLGARSRRRILTSGGRLRGEGFALAGMVIGVIGVVASIAYLVFLVMNPNFVSDFMDRFTSTTTTGG